MVQLLTLIKCGNIQVMLKDLNCLPSSHISFSINNMVYDYIYRCIQCI